MLEECLGLSPPGAQARACNLQPGCFFLRPPRAGKIVMAAIKATRGLPWETKAVWLEDWLLDQTPAGSYASARVLAMRLGLSEDGVDRRRRFLHKMGFYERADGYGRRAGGWVPRCPRGLDIPSRVSPESVTALAETIAAYLDGQLVPHPESGWTRDAKAAVQARGSPSAPLDAEPVPHPERGTPSAPIARKDGISYSPLVPSLTGDNLLLHQEVITGKDGTKDEQEGIRGKGSDDWEALRVRLAERRAQVARGA